MSKNVKSNTDFEKIYKMFTFCRLSKGKEGPIYYCVQLNKEELS